MLIGVNRGRPEIYVVSSPLEKSICKWEMESVEGQMTQCNTQDFLALIISLMQTCERGIFESGHVVISSHGFNSPQMQIWNSAGLTQK